MKRHAPCAVLALACIAAPAYALYSVSLTGDWPKTWPKALEPLRKQARTLVGPTILQRHYAIRFRDQKEFQAAWPNLLKVKTKKAPIFLVRGENFLLGEHVRAGVIVHCPPVQYATDRRFPEGPIAGLQRPREQWANTNFIEIVDDGDIVDADRIALPKNCPIIDERAANRNAE